jgi:hypothetical protein
MQSLRAVGESAELLLQRLPLFPPLACLESLAEDEACSQLFRFLSGRSRGPSTLPAVLKELLYYVPGELDWFVHLPLLKQGDRQELTHLALLLVYYGF